MDEICSAHQDWCWRPDQVLVTTGCGRLQCRLNMYRGVQLQVGPCLVAQPTPLHVSMCPPQAQSGVASLSNSCLHLPIKGHALQNLSAAACPIWVLVARKEQTAVEQLQPLLTIYPHLH